MVKNNKSSRINININTFEIKLLIIAILLPLFFTVFPDLINQILFYPFTFQFALVVSYSLGILWFLLLLGGMVIISNKRVESTLFDGFFREFSHLTIFIFLFVFFAYLYGFLLLKMPTKWVMLTFIIIYILLILVNIIRYVLKKNEH